MHLSHTESFSSRGFVGRKRDKAKPRWSRNTLSGCCDSHTLVPALVVLVEGKRVSTTSNCQIDSSESSWCRRDVQQLAGRVAARSRPTVWIVVGLSTAAVCLDAWADEPGEERASCGTSACHSGRGKSSREGSGREESEYSFWMHVVECLGC